MTGDIAQTVGRRGQKLGYFTTSPYQTDGRYCVYDEPFGTYVYTSAWVKRILKDIGTVEKYRSFFGHGPSMAVSQLADQARNESAQGETAEDRSA